MKKRIFLTSLLLAAGAIALGSCGSKKVVDSKDNESNNSVIDDNGANDILNGGENETNEEKDLEFFDENAFELPADFNFKKLRKANLSLKQEALIDQAYQTDFTAYEAKQKMTRILPFMAMPFEMTSEITSSGQLYSNNVLKIEAEQIFDDGGYPVLGPVAPSIPVLEPEIGPVLRALPEEAKLVIDGPTAVKKRISSDPFYDNPPFDYQSSDLTIAQKNYTFHEHKMTSDVYNDYDTYFNSYDESDSLENYLNSSVPHMSPYFYSGFGNGSYYQYDDTHIIEVFAYTYPDARSQIIGYDDYDDPIYGYVTTIENSYTLNVFEINENGYNIVFGRQYFDMKSDYIYDDWDERYVSLGGMKTIDSIQIDLKISNKQIEYDFTNDLTKFKYDLNDIKAYEPVYSLTNGKVASSTSMYNDSYDCKFNGTKDGALNFEFEYHVYDGYGYTLNTDVSLNVLNDKVLNDEKLAETDVQYETVSQTIVLDDIELPEDLEYQTYDGKKYIVIKDDVTDRDSVVYKLFLDVNISVNENGEIEAKVNSVDYIKTYERVSLSVR